MEFWSLSLLWLHALFSVQVANHVGSRCVEMLAGVGFTKDFPVEKFYRDSKIGMP